MGFVSRCIDPVMVILLVAKQAIRLFLPPLYVHCKELDRMLFQTSHVNRFADIDQIKVSVVTKSDHFVTDEPPLQ